MSTSPSWNVRRQWLFLLSGASFSTTSHITLAGVDVSVLLESENLLLGLLDEVGYYLLVVLDVLAFFEDRKHSIECSAHYTFAVLRVEIDDLVAKLLLNGCLKRGCICSINYA